MPPPEEKKIIVDDDWKARVQQEKEQLRSPAPGDAAEPGATPERAASSEPPLPPASFDALVSMLVTQTLAALGQIPVGENQEPVVMLDHAKYTIDLLGVLEQKTAGNLSPAEAKMLTGVLHELRMVFVAMQNKK